MTHFAHLEDILLMMQSNNHCTRTHKEKCFKKGVCKDMKKRTTVSTQTNGDKHIP